MVQNKQCKFYCRILFLCCLIIKLGTYSIYKWSWVYKARGKGTIAPRLNLARFQKLRENYSMCLDNLLKQNHRHESCPIGFPFSDAKYRANFALPETGTYRDEMASGARSKFGAPPCSNLKSFGRKCTVLKKVLVTLLEVGIFGTTRNDSAPPP